MAQEKTHWDDLETVLVLVQRGSLAAASAELGISYTTVARRVARIEAATGQVLFVRSGDGYLPTEAGLTMAHHAADMQSAQNAMMRALTGQDQALTGKLTITAPQLMIAHVLCPVLQAFRQAHPEVELEVKGTNTLLDLDRREADLAFRISRAPGDNLTGLRLAVQETASFATQAWADRFAADPKAPLDWVAYVTHKTLPDQVMQTAPGSRIQYHFDDMVVMAGAAQAGLGIARMPMFLGRALPGLVQVPILPPQPYADIWLVAHPDVWPSARVRAFRDILVPYIKAHRSDFVG